jgi:hypothetical protein
VKLHANSRVLPMYERHDHPLLGAGRDLELDRKARLGDDQGMVPCDAQPRGQAAEDAAAAVYDPLVRPCMGSGARTIWPPNAAPIA